jgi:LysW-gamma-L-lysine carboxypeptidase
MDDSAAIALLRGLVAIESLSHQEEEATAWLAAQMQALGYARAYVDDVGNAVGEIGPLDAACVIVLLGHIDTVPGQIPVRIEQGANGSVLYGRGSVDAKGPLATFVAAGAQLGDAWATQQGVRVVVVGAVEEEAATSKGARFVRDRFDGVREPVPAACIIGEPSGWSRVTLGYKGRLLVEFDAAQPMAHTAGPDAGIGTAAVAFWQWIEGEAALFNAGRAKVFAQLQPSIRRLNTWTDGAMWDHAEAHVGLRLPVGFDAPSFAQRVVAWAEAWAGIQAATQAHLTLGSEQPLRATIEGEAQRVSLRFHAHEAAWRSERTTPIARAFLTSIRNFDPFAKPAFVLKTGTSDMNVVAPRWQCPIVAYGPGDSSLDHTPNEHVPLDEYRASIQIVADTVREFASFSAG